MATYLTKRQKEILDFIEDFRRQHGYSPTHREICDRFGYSSYGTVHKHLKLLEGKGYLRRHGNQKRGVELTARSSGRRGRSSEGVPFFGLIAAGKPIEAVAGDEQVVVPPLLRKGRDGDHFVLKVAGNSMIDEGIHDGDLVVVMRREEAEQGEMVVALVGDDATLKRLYREGETVRLQPANREMEPIRLPARDVRVQGVVVGLMRKF